MKLTNVERCLDGHPDDFRHLVRRYQPVLLAHLAGKLGSRDGAEEAAQESLVRAYFKMETLKKPESFFSWLLGIAENVAKEQQRKEMVRRQRESVRMVSEEAPQPELSQDYALEAAVAGLPETYRTVILLRYYGGLACHGISEQEKQGKLTLDIQQPTDKSQPIIVTAIYAPDGRSPGRQVVFHVDQATKLVTVIEYYHQGSDGQLTFTARQENYDYNVPIAADMFVLDDEVPADVMRVDQVAQDVGLPQGTMTDEQVVVEVVRQFFEALKAGAYDKAGMLLGGIPAKDTQRLLGNMKVVGIVSIGEPKPHPIPGVGGFVVPCKIEMENPDGSKSIKEFSGVGVRPVDRNRQADRWNIEGGI